MKFSGSQYHVDRMVYELEKEEKDGKIISRFKKLDYGVMPLTAIYLTYSAIPEGGGKRKFVMNLWDGRRNIFFNGKHVKPLKGYVSIRNGELNKDFEEKVREMLVEALNLPK